MAELLRELAILLFGIGIGLLASSYFVFVTGSGTDLIWISVAFLFLSAFSSWLRDRKREKNNG